MLQNVNIAVALFAIALASPVLTAPSFADTGEATFRQASSLYQQSRWEAAALAFDRFLATPAGPVDAAAAKFFAAECYTQLGDAETALDRYQRLLSADPPEPYRSSAQFRIGEALWKQGLTPQASDQLRKFAENQEQSVYLPYAWFYLGAMAAEQQDWSCAIAAYRHVLEGPLLEEAAEHPLQVDAQLHLADALIAAKQLDAALAILQPLGESTDSTVAADAMLATCRAQFTGAQYETALETARTLASRHPGASAVLQARLVAGWSLWKLDRFEEIEVWLQPISEAAAATNEVRVLRGMTAYARKEWAESHEHLSLAAQLAPERLNLAFYAGESARRTADNASSEKWLQHAFDGEPDGPWADDALWSLAQLAVAAGDAEQAESRFALLRSCFPTSPYSSSEFSRQATRHATLLVEAVSLERDGRYDAALAAYHELNQQDGSEHDGEAIWRHAQLLERMEHQEEAATLYERLKSSFPAHRRAAAAQLALAHHAARQHDSGAAEPRFRQVLLQHPETPQASEAACWLAGRAIEHRQYDAARSDLQTVLDAEPTAPVRFVQFAQHLLLTIETAEQDWPSARLAALRLQELSEEGPLRLSAEFWLAESEFRLGNDEAAQAAFESFGSRAAGVEEGVAAMAPLRLAQLAARRQKWSQVLELLEDHDARFPTFALRYEVDYQRGRALAGRGQMREARAQYRRVLATPAAQESETAAMAQWMIGETYFHQENYQAARAAYTEVIEQHRQAAWQARAALQAGKCCELLVQWDAAAVFYREAPVADADPDSKKQLQARLEWTETRLAQSTRLDQARSLKK